MGLWSHRFSGSLWDHNLASGAPTGASAPGGNPLKNTNLNRPVESVSWLDATNYCARLTEQQLAAGRISPGGHYRLPTEAEWEQVARAGTSPRFSHGDDPGVPRGPGHQLSTPLFSERQIHAHS